MKHLLLLVLTALGLSHAHRASAAPPNDDCSNATALIAGVPTAFNTTEATPSGEAAPDESQCAGTFLGWGTANPDVWFSFTAPIPALLNLSTCSAGSFDTSMAVYRGSCGNLSQIACNGDSATSGACQQYYSAISDLPVAAGETVYIRVGGYSNGAYTEQGRGQLTVTYTLDAHPCNGVFRSGNLGPVGFGAPVSHTFTAMRAASGDATLIISVRGDLNLATEYLTLRLDGTTYSDPLFVNGANDCPAIPDTVELTIPLAQLQALIADGSLTVRLEASPLVSSTQCTAGSSAIELRYPIFALDCDANGVEDACEVISAVFDCNENDVPDACDIAEGASQDIDGDDRPDECEDCDGNGLPDDFELAQGTAPDCNGNLAIDSCDIASGYSLDLNGNGVPDSCEGDCDNDGIADFLEIARNPSKDCDLDAVLDSCEITANPLLDCNLNAVIDSCDIGAGARDCDADGVLDSCEIANGAQDKDVDGVLDDCEFGLGDFNLDGTVAGADLAFLLSIWGVTGSPLGDLNRDGLIAGADLAILLSNWGPY